MSRLKFHTQPAAALIITHTAIPRMFKAYKIVEASFTSNISVVERKNVLKKKLFQERNESLECDEMLEA